MMEEHPATRAPVKKFLLPLLLASFASSASAGLVPHPMAIRNDDVTVAVAGDLAWLSGEARQRVFAKGSSVEDADPRFHRDSRLDWDLRNVFFAGGSGSIRTCRVCFNGGVWWGLSAGGSGSMEDFAWGADGGGDPEGYAKSDASVDAAVIADGNVSFDVIGSSEGVFALYPFAGFRMDRFEWEGDRGRAIPAMDEDGRPVSLAGKVEYRQEYIQGYLGLGSSLNIGRRFSLAAYGRFAPVYRGKDHEKRVEGKFVAENHGNRKSFEDVAWGFGLRAEWAVTPHVFAVACVDWTRYAFSEGDRRIRDYGDFEVEDEPEEEEEESGGDSESSGNGAKKAGGKKNRKEPYKGLGGMELEYLTFSLGLAWRL